MFKLLRPKNGYKGSYVKHVLFYCRVQTCHLFNPFFFFIFLPQPDEKPDISYSDIGGMDMQKQEMKEAVELPLTHFDLYKQIGIDPPRGVLMYGPPGCGKTMLAKAVAHHTTASFIRVVGSEFVQKYLGEGPRMVRDVFR